ncbi:glycosyltransferase family 4 protein [bacterium]|nr:glycosyltransferase family 4 protein [bacterium]
MRICHIITRLIVGGAQENTVATCIGLLRRGHTVDLVIGPQTGPEGSLARQASAAGVPLLVVDQLRRAPHPVWDLAACLALARLFRARRYDLVHTHSGKAGFLGRLAARWAGVPIVIHTIHGPSFHPHQNPLGNWLFTWAERLAAEWTDRLVSVADAMTEQYLAAGVGQPAQYLTIRSGMDIAAFRNAKPEPELRARLGLNAGDLVVGKVARLFRLKGHEYLLAAAPRIVAAVPRAKFLLVGDGAYRARFEREARARGLADRFVFAGLVPPADMPRYIALMDVLVHLSLREGLPRTLPQALAGGKPVVAFDVDGAREVCLPGETGLLLRAGDTAGLAAAVSRLLQDRSLARTMGERGQALVSAEFTEERMVAAIDDLYRRCERTRGD